MTKIIRELNFWADMPTIGTVCNSNLIFENVIPFFLIQALVVLTYMNWPKLRASIYLV